MVYCSVIGVLALVGLTKKPFGHYAILKILSLRSPNERNPFNEKSGQIWLRVDRNGYISQKSYLSGQIWITALSFQHHTSVQNSIKMTRKFSYFICVVVFSLKFY